MVHFNLERLKHIAVLLLQTLYFGLGGPVRLPSTTSRPTLPKTISTLGTHAAKIITTTVSKVNSTDNSGNKSVTMDQKNISKIAMRAFYVITAVCIVVVFYFIVRAVYSRRRRSKTRRYGMLRQEGGDMELRPLSEGEDDEDDLTLFDATKRKSSTRR